MSDTQFSENLMARTKFTKTLIDSFPPNFIKLLVSVYFFVKGFMSSTISLSLLPFLRNQLGVNETTYQIYLIIIYTPWSIKALIGILSDLYPLGGYSKKWYMFISTILGTISLLLLGFFPFKEKNRIIAPFLMFFVFIQITSVDLLCEGEYAKRIKKKTIKEGETVVSFVWGCIVLGSFIASLFVGIFTDYYKASHVYLIALPFTLQVLVPIWKNYMGEKKKSPDSIYFDTKKLKENTGIFFLAISMSSLALWMISVNLFFSEHVVLTSSIITSVVLCFLCASLQKPRIARCNIYLFLVEATYIQIPGALDYWYTASDKCVPAGPAFDMTYYLTYTNMIGSVSGLLGIFFFNRFISKLTIRRSFIVASAIRITASLFDIFIVMRINKTLGIPDRLAYLFGDALVMNTSSMLVLMPAIMLTTNTVMEGLESTTYAILAGFQNLGSQVSKSFGVAMIKYFKIDAETTPCQFEKLPQLIIVCHFLIPIIPIFLAPFLLPAGYASEEKSKNVTSTSTEYNELENTPNSNHSVESTSENGGDNDSSEYEKMNKEGRGNKIASDSSVLDIDAKEKSRDIKDIELTASIKKVDVSSDYDQLSSPLPKS